MATVRATSFRDLNGKVLFLESSALLSIAPEMMKPVEGDNGIVVIGFIDPELGLSFYVVGSALYVPGENLRVTWVGREYRIIARFEDVADIEVTDVEKAQMDVSSFSTLRISVARTYAADPQRQLTRGMTFLDSNRCEGFPDDVTVIMFQPGKQPEKHWVRCTGQSRECIRGILLSEPEQDFGVHKDETIDFVPAQDDDGTVMLVSGGRKQS